MTLLAIYSSPTTPGGPGWGEDVSGAIRLGSITGLAGEAEMGAVGQGNIVLDDPLGTVGHASDGIVGLKQFSFTETACPAGNQRLYTAYVADRRYHRGQQDSLITTVARKIDVTLTDLNSFLSFRVFAPTADDPTSDFVRPAETDLERVQALLTTVDFISTTLFDIGYIPSTGGVDMDANDYTGQRPIDVLNDCAQASGRNFFVLYDEASNHLVLWYDVWTTDGSSTLAYDSPVALTNVESEQNESNVFAIAPDAVGVLDPSRLVSGVYLPFDGGTAYGTDPTTAYTYAWRDAVMPSVNVKTLTKANALVTRYLADNNTEDERISCTVRVPNTVVTSIHEGMRIQVHFTHVPAVQTSFTWCRILQRTIRQDVETEVYYWLDLELSPIPPIVSDAYLLSFIAQRSDIGYDTGHGYGPAITPLGRDSACGVVPIVLSGTSFSYLGGGAAGWHDPFRPSDYAFDAAYRSPAVSEPMTNQWGNAAGGEALSGSRQTVYSLELSGASGVPIALATLSHQPNGSTLTGPTVTCPGKGWLFGFFTNSTGGTFDGRAAYTFSATSGSVVEVRQAYGDDQVAAGFSPRSWLGYLPVASAGSHSISLTLSVAPQSDTHWGCIMVFVPTASTLSVVQFVHSGEAVSGDACWDWSSAP